MLLGQLRESIELGARQLAGAGVDAAYDAPIREDVGEHLELGAGHRFSEIAQLQTEASVRPVDSVPGHRLRERHPPPRRWCDVETLPLEHGAHHGLHALDHVVLVDERHLEVELRELWLAVCPGVLIAKAARDLVVALQ